MRTHELQPEGGKALVGKLLSRALGAETGEFQYDRAESSLTEKVAQCPNCGYSDTEDGFYTKVRQGNTETKYGPANVVDVGYQCPKCNKEFGFEVFKD